MKTSERKITDHWDHKLPKSVLRDNDLEAIAHGISSAMHYCTGTKQCEGYHGGLCAMCGNAMRLVVQSAEPRIIETVVKRMLWHIGFQSIDLHPRCADD